MRLRIFLYCLLLFSCAACFSGVNGGVEPSGKAPLIVFHIDMNSVALTKEQVKEQLSAVAAMGYNAVLWEVEDKIKWKTCPECVSPEAFSKEEFRNILKFSDSLGLVSIPLLQTIGHAEYVLKNEKYKSLRELPERYDCYCEANVEVKKLLKQWIEEYIDLFGNVKYFHLGGDEAYVFASCPACLEACKKKSKGEIYAEYENELAADLIKRGIRPGLWGDMLLHFTEGLNFLSKKFIVWDWNYWDGCNTPDNVMVWCKGGRLSLNEIAADVKNEFPCIVSSENKLVPFYTGDYLKNKGFDVIISASSRSYGDAVFAGVHKIHSDNIAGAAKKTMEAGLYGMCVTSWGVRIAPFETQKQWIFLAPLTLKNNSLPLGGLLSDCYLKLFGANDSLYSEAFSSIGYSFPFANEKSTGIMWTGMKDSRPAPKGYIKDLIEKWKTGNSKRWNEAVESIKEAKRKISEGDRLLDNLMYKSTTGFNILGAWKKAAYFQSWQAFFAERLVLKEEGRSKSEKKEIVKLIKQIKKEYAEWALLWMQPLSAETNAGLIYDALIDYFEN
jgi:hypothetical protein